MEDRGRAINWDSRCVCKSTATREDHSRLGRPLYFRSCAGKPLARNTRNPAAFCSHSLSGLISVRKHTLCITLIPWKRGRSSKWMQPQLLVPSTVSEPLSNCPCNAAILSFRETTSKHLAFYACVAVCWVCRARSGSWCNKQSVYLQHYLIFCVLSKLLYCAEPTFFGIHFLRVWMSFKIILIRMGILYT